MPGGHRVVGADLAFGRKESYEVSLVRLCFLEDVESFFAAAEIPDIRLHGKYYVVYRIKKDKL